MHNTIRRTTAAAATATAAIAIAAGTAPVTAQAATPRGTPPANSNSHLTIQINGECTGQAVTVVAGDSEHAAAQVISGGVGHLLPVSFTFIYADGSQFTELVARHNTQPTVTCHMGGVGPDGAPVAVDLTVVWQQVGS